MNRIALIIQILGRAAGMVLASRLLLHYFQLESYQFQGYFRTVRRQWKKALLPGVLLALGCLCATPAIRQRLLRQMTYRPVLATVITVALFLVSTAFLVYGSYNPFLYFRF